MTEHPVLVHSCLHLLNLGPQVLSLAGPNNELAGATGHNSSSMAGASERLCLVDMVLDQALAVLRQIKVGACFSKRRFSKGSTQWTLPDGQCHRLDRPVSPWVAAWLLCHSSC